MLRRYALGFSNVGRQLSTMSSNTPLEDTIRAKVSTSHSTSLAHPIPWARLILTAFSDHCGTEPIHSGDLQ